MRRRQRGAALIIFATVLILGVAWFAVGALGKAAVAVPERETETGLALQAGKQALLAYVAQYAARSTTANPGQMPCPESVTLANPGEASTSCSATNINVGRLPWKTLGIDQIRDGNGEPLWYMVRGFRNAPINFGTPGQLTHSGSTVVALIIAPGVPLNTAALAAAAPAGCTKQNQMVSTRNSASLNAANFIECGLATGSVASPGNSTFTNDRVIAITTEEWADAMAPAIADRLQRQVAPAMYDYFNVTSVASWGERFFPNASTFNVASPATNNLCGNVDVREGMPPTATRASGACDTDWNGGSLWGLGSLLSLGGCWTTATDVRCSFTVILAGIASPSFQLTAPRVGYSFRSFNPADIRIRVNGGAPQNVTVRSYAGGGVSDWDGSSSITFELEFPWLTIATNVEVVIPWASDALLADARSAWWVSNGWDRFTYYAVARAATSDPGFDTCNPAAYPSVGTSCLTINGIPAPNRDTDKRLVLVLTGRALKTTLLKPNGQAWGTTDPADYFEGLTNPADAASNTTVGDRTYTMATVSTLFNDRVAACPFKYSDANGMDVVICN